MIDKEAAELRRRLRPDRSNITKIHGCYINQFGEIVTTFDDSMAMLPVEEQEKYHELLKKAVSGTMGKTLSDVVFSTAQVQSSPEHGLLMKLRDSKLSDAEARKELYGKIAATVRLGENVGVLVLLACDTYDVPYRSGDGETQADGGDTQFTYILCSICPVKEGRPSFRYDAAEQAFHNRGADWTVSAPELGFLFPAFDDRAANLYGALFYHRSKEDSYESFVEAVFHTRPPMTLGAQKDAFREVLVDSLENECSLSLVQTVHRELREMAVTHKEAHIPEPLTVGAREVGEILESSGVSAAKAAAFRVNYEQAFGVDNPVPPQNLLNASQLEYKTPDVVIKVAPDRTDLVSMREFGGVKYLLIKADEGVELNGVAVQ